MAKAEPRRRSPRYFDQQRPPPPPTTHVRSHWILLSVGYFNLTAAQARDQKTADPIPELTSGLENVSVS